MKVNIDQGKYMFRDNYINNTPKTSRRILFPSSGTNSNANNNNKPIDALDILSCSRNKILLNSARTCNNIKSNLSDHLTKVTLKKGNLQKTPEVLLIGTPKSKQNMYFNYFRQIEKMALQKN